MTLRIVAGIMFLMAGGSLVAHDLWHAITDPVLLHLLVLVGGMAWLIIDRLESPR